VERAILVADPPKDRDKVPSTHATGVHVRHAVSRALATNNLRPQEATYQVLTARVTLSSTRRVRRAEVTLRIRPPRPLTQWEPHEVSGWVNPDGAHPQMALVRLDNPLFVDVFPVTWDAWLRVPAGETRSNTVLPDGVDPLCPKTGADLAEASAFAHSLGKRLPTREELKSLWGTARWPWGEHADDRLGRTRYPRMGDLFEVGMHPPVQGLFDLGAWLWHLDAEGRLGCGVVDGSACFGHPAATPTGPVGFRCVVDP